MRVRIATLQTDCKRYVNLQDPHPPTGNWKLVAGSWQLAAGN